MDYKELLIKYIDHVMQSEGYSFIEFLNFTPHSDVQFTEQEVQELKGIEKQVIDNWNTNFVK